MTRPAGAPASRPTACPATVAGEYGDLFAEIERFRSTGIDGLFTDNTDVAVAQRDDRLVRR